MKRLEQFSGTIGIALLLMLAFISVDQWKMTKQRHAEPSPILPDMRPAQGLQLHRWYRPTSDLYWSWRAVNWLPGPGGPVKKGVPLYVIDKRGNVVVMRGAVHQAEILVPDSQEHFSPLDAWPGGIGDLPKGDPKDEPAPDPRPMVLTLDSRGRVQCVTYTYRGCPCGDGCQCEKCECRRDQ